MVKVKAGERTKQLIIDTCKPLFYHNGIDKTTFGMICSQADIAPGSISYHFSGKMDIATSIADEFSAQLEGTIEKYIPLSGLEHWVDVYVVVKARWYVILRDPNLRRYYKEIYNNETYSHSVLATLQMHRPFVNRELTGTGLTLIAATVVGQDSMLFDLAEQHPDIYTFQLISNHVLFTFFRLLDLDKSVMERAMKEGELLFQKVKDHLDFAFFKEFSYQTSP